MYSVCWQFFWSKSLMLKTFAMLPFSFRVFHFWVWSRGVFIDVGAERDGFLHVNEWGDGFPEEQMFARNVPVHWQQMERFDMFDDEWHDALGGLRGMARGIRNAFGLVCIFFQVVFRILSRYVSFLIIGVTYMIVRLDLSLQRCLCRRFGHLQGAHQGCHEGYIVPCMNGSSRNHGSSKGKASNHCSQLWILIIPSPQIHKNLGIAMSKWQVYATFQETYYLLNTFKYYITLSDAVMIIIQNRWF